jgi:hypothetical protein
MVKGRPALSALVRPFDFDSAQPSLLATHGVKRGGGRIVAVRNGNIGDRSKNWFLNRPTAATQKKRDCHSYHGNTDNEPCVSFGVPVSLGLYAMTIKEIVYHDDTNPSKKKQED